MSQFRRRVAEITGIAESALERLSGGDLSEVLLVTFPAGSRKVAKGGFASAEAAMLRAIAEAGVPAPLVEGEHDDVLLIEHVPNDGLLSPRAWADLGAVLRRLHDRTGERYGWPADFAIGSVEIVNRQTDDWPSFWADQRLLAPSALLDRPWRERIAQAAELARASLPPAPPPALLHGDMWTGNVLVRDGRVAALIDPCCYFGDAEVDLAMLTLFAQPPDEFWSAYGETAPEAEQRRAFYQLFPALLHLRLFGASYGSLVERLLAAIGA